MRLAGPVDEYIVFYNSRMDSLLRFVSMGGILYLGYHIVNTIRYESLVKKSRMIREYDCHLTQEQSSVRDAHLPREGGTPREGQQVSGGPRGQAPHQSHENIIVLRNQAPGEDSREGGRGILRRHRPRKAGQAQGGDRPTPASLQEYQSQKDCRHRGLEVSGPVFMLIRLFSKLYLFLLSNKI